MSKFKKIAVCCTSIIIIITLSLCFCFSASAATNMTLSNILYEQVGSLKADYDYSNFKIYQASWYHLDGSFIGNSAVNKVQNGYFQFKDVHSHGAVAKLEFRITVEVPTEYLNVPYDYYFQFYANSAETLGYLDLSHISTVKYSYGHADQQRFSLDYFEFVNTAENGNSYERPSYGYIADNKGIVLKRNIIQFSFYIDLNGTSPGAQYCYEFLLGGVRKSADNPSSPAYDKYNKDDINGYKESEDKLINETQGRFLSSFYEVIDTVESSQFFIKTQTAFACATGLFDSLLYKIPYLRLILYVSITISVLSVFLGLAVRNSHRW